MVALVGDLGAAVAFGAVGGPALVWAEVGDLARPDLGLPLSLQRGCLGHGQLMAVAPELAPRVVVVRQPVVQTNRRVLQVLCASERSPHHT